MSTLSLEELASQITLDVNTIKNIVIDFDKKSLYLQEHDRYLFLKTDNEFLLQAANLENRRNYIYIIDCKYLSKKQFAQFTKLAKEFYLKFVVVSFKNCNNLIRYIRNNYSWKQAKEIDISDTIRKSNGAAKDDEKHVSYLLEQNLRRSGAQALRKEYSTPFGRIDILTDKYLIEIKHFHSWKNAIGQLITYDSFFGGNKKKRQLVLYTFLKRSEKLRNFKSIEKEFRSLLEQYNILWIHHNWDNDDIVFSDLLSKAEAERRVNRS